MIKVVKSEEHECVKEAVADMRSFAKDFENLASKTFKKSDCHFEDRTNVFSDSDSICEEGNNKHF